MKQNGTFFGDLLEKMDSHKLEIENKTKTRLGTNYDRFNNDLKEIQELSSRRKAIQIEKEKIDQECYEHSQKFIKNYSEYTPVIGQYESYLDNTITPDQLMNILDRESNVPEPKLRNIILSNLNDSREKDQYYYNTIQMMEEYGDLLNSVDSLEMCSNSRLLDNEYLIKKEFSDLLINA